MLFRHTVINFFDGTLVHGCSQISITRYDIKEVQRNGLGKKSQTLNPSFLFFNPNLLTSITRSCLQTVFLPMSLLVL